MMLRNRLSISELQIKQIKPPRKWWPNGSIVLRNLCSLRYAVSPD
jgi:hypothetical protein